ncbi:MAG: 2-methylcitrate dehydratase [Polynucleobacter sp. 24-46-87]|jgi:2-methylcitrate dehydratase PrpD|uniref:MmgE/PrpD family protein n=1 Tax=unclassified Polynucleobacter TaxID=2640945 RepID=UPI000BD7E078|nr:MULTISPECIES: MmgE/PrpD family protein [unclassified Polynucleobacter]OYY21735.1 MAG: 2-methylcitrate dehydratase [Polynucleobacter sp. 35-46-11]OZA14845.1 MAG: 2-methylcitrate dehydratase [Polynucleobacter sp. 24-46-87]OZA78405.1 MAG: 2-methylcitrate dehydratase [Polynucleobacter sp. 39-46-10]
MTTSHLSKALATFAAELTISDIPEEVIARTEDLLVDWFGSAIAGKGSRPVETITQFAQSMGGFNAANPGSAEILISRKSSSPFLAVLANAAASHVAEQDDVHNGSVFHPATVVFPAALATAQTIGASGEDLLVATVVGYEVGIRVGEFLGRSHYKTFHTTGTAGTLAAAAAVGHLLKLNPNQMLHAFGSAGTQSAGLWEFLRDAADSKQLHTAHASSTGLMSAYLAQSGFTGAEHILEGKQGLAAGMSSDADPSKLIDRLGSRWTIAETSFKYHASCRHTHPAADALLQVMLKHHLKPNDIAKVETLVHQGAIDVLGPVTDPATVHQSKFSMGTVLALIAHYRFAGLQEFDQHFHDQVICAFRDRVTMILDPEVDSAYPQRWIGKVKLYLQNGDVLEGRVDEPKGDPGNTLSRAEITDKAMRLAAFSGGATPSEMSIAIERLWNIRKEAKIGLLIS